jgi:hypothetical protein
VKQVNRFNRVAIAMMIVAVLLMLMSVAFNVQTLRAAQDKFDSIQVRNLSDLRGWVRLGTFLEFRPASSVVVTNGTTITPYASFQPLTSASSAITYNAISLITTSVPTGREIMLVNTTTPTLVFSDTGALALSGDVSLGQYDMLKLLFDGTQWIQIGASNN